VNTNVTTRAGFKTDAAKDDFVGILMYKLQRKKSLESNADSVFTEDKSTSIQLLVSWRYNSQNSFSVCALFIKHEDIITWNNDKLRELDSMYRVLPNDGSIIKDTWLLDDAIALTTTLKWGMGHTIEISISEGDRKDDSVEPLLISSSM
jgi:hypothetical protein